MKYTQLGIGDAFSFMTSLTRIRGDRIFGTVSAEFRDQVKSSQASGLFTKVPGALHTAAPGYVSADSFKTFEPYGNLQLTFFNKIGTLEFLVDADIDDAQGIEHVFQVVGHAVSRGDTNPFDIHEILLGYQKLNPGYDLIV